MEKILSLKNLSVTIPTPVGRVEAVRNVSLDLNPGEVLALVGESGCGKSMLCKSVLKLLPEKAAVSGQIILKGKEITACSEREMQCLRGKDLTMVFQDPMLSLDPTMTVGAQIAEVITCHEKSLRGKALMSRVHQLLAEVGIDRAEERAKLYPYHFSGGMRQRVVVAMALAGNPQVLLADEPTTALDATVQAQIIELLRRIARENNMATILVSHDLGVVSELADRIAIMYAGKVIEVGQTAEILFCPAHPYTQGLLKSLPAMSQRGKFLTTIPGMPPSLINLPQGDAFAPRNPRAMYIDYYREPPMFEITPTHLAATWLLDPRAPKIEAQAGLGLAENMDSSVNDGRVTYNVLKHKFDRVQGQAQAQGQSDHSQGQAREDTAILQVENLTHYYYLNRKNSVAAVADLSLDIHRGEIFGLVGESGSGKSTVAKCIMNICHPTAGKIIFNGIDLSDRHTRRKNKAYIQQKCQLIFQDSASGLNQKMTVEDIITEPLVVQKLKPRRGTLRAEAEFQLEVVGLGREYLFKHPYELSGGQRQRVGIARALVTEPELLVADEPIASLDVSIQAQIVNLFRHLRDEHGFSILFIAHDLSMVKYLCDQVGVLREGHLVECGPTEEIFNAPKHPYTRTLIGSVPKFLMKGTVYE